MADRVISGVACSYPSHKARDILSCGNRDLTWCPGSGRLAEQRFTGEAESPAIQLDVDVSRIVFARFVATHTPLDVLNTRQPRTGVFISRITQPHGRDLLAPEPLGPLLADASSPRR
jgi:hypothetical protein